MTKINKGMKFDDGKKRWDLLPITQIEQIVEILTFGANKYTDNSWQAVENGVDRYYAALMRHLVDWRKGEDIDPESGFTHLAHAACNAIFLMYLTDIRNMPKDAKEGVPDLFDDMKYKICRRTP